MKRWQWGVARVIDHGLEHDPIRIVADEAEARAFVEANYPRALMYRRPMPKPWELVPYTRTGEA